MRDRTEIRNEVTRKSHLYTESHLYAELMFEVLLDIRDQNEDIKSLLKEIAESLRFRR